MLKKRKQALQINRVLNRASGGHHHFPQPVVYLFGDLGQSISLLFFPPDFVFSPCFISSYCNLFEVVCFLPCVCVNPSISDCLPVSS